MRVAYDEPAAVARHPHQVGLVLAANIACRGGVLGEALGLTGDMPWPVVCEQVANGWRPMSRVTRLC